MKEDRSIPDKVDVLVAGAGPAGLSATNRLRGAGANVLLVDSREKIGFPSRCGELTRRKLFKAFRVEPHKVWIRSTFRKYPKTVMIDRERFESDFAQLLAERGASVRSSTSVVSVSPYNGSGRLITLLTPKGEDKVFASCVIAADGISSLVARSCGVETRLPPEELASCFGYRFRDVKLRDPEDYRIEYLPGLYPFYFWVFPNGSDQANVGLSLPAREGFKVRELLDKKIKESPLISGGKVLEEFAGIYPVSKPLEKPYRDGLLVAGTAARLVNPLTGEGIIQAATSGAAAAETYLGASSTESKQLAAYRRGLGPLYNSLLAQCRKVKALN